jgi:lipoprotein-releasing system permease protein
MLFTDSPSIREVILFRSCGKRVRAACASRGEHVEKKYCWRNGSRPSSRSSLSSRGMRRGRRHGVDLRAGGDERLRRELKDRILGATAHVHVTSLEGSIPDPFSRAEAVRRTGGVSAASPYIFSQMMISSGSGSVGGVLRGVDIPTIGSVTRLARDLRSGSLDELRRAGERALPGVILGKELAGNLAVGLGDVVEVLVPGGSFTPLGAFPKTARFRVAGISESGMYEYDATFAYVAFDEAGRLLGMEGRATGIEVKVDDIYRAADVA